MNGTLPATTPEGDAASGPVPWSDPAVVLATCWWIGRVPRAPGTFGAALGIAVAVLLPACGAGPVSEATAVTALVLAGIPICGAAARRMGRGGDPGAIVWDEMASVPAGLLVVPQAERTAWVLLAAFLLHRLFDIWKPFPCRQLDRLHGGFGIVADDLGAAAWTAACLLVLRQSGLLAAS